MMFKVFTGIICSSIVFMLVLTCVNTGIISQKIGLICLAVSCLLLIYIDITAIKFIKLLFGVNSYVKAVILILLLLCSFLLIYLNCTIIADLYMGKSICLLCP